MKPYICGDSTLYLPSGGCDCNYTLQEIETTEFARLYHLMLNGEQVGDPVEVPLDKYVVSGDVKTVAYADTPYDGAEVGDKYFQLNLANTDEKVYIPLGALDLNNYYTKAEVDALIPQISACDVYQIGDVIITSDPNPTLPCGRWEQIDKEFTPYSNGNATVNWNTTNTSGSYDENTRRCIVIRSGHSVSVRLWWKNRIAYTTGEYVIGSIPYSTLGITGSYQHFVLGQTVTVRDAVSEYIIGNTDPMVITHRGLATFGTQTQIDANQELYIEFNHIALPTTMDDAACNKFYWRKYSDDDR